MNWTLDRTKWQSLVRGAVLAGVGAALTYATQAVTGADFGQLGPIVAAALAVAANYLRKANEPQAPAAN